MASTIIAPPSFHLLFPSSSSSFSSSSSSSSSSSTTLLFLQTPIPSTRFRQHRRRRLLKPPFPPSFSFGNNSSRATEYKFPDPIPEFAVAETDKFKAHLLQRLSKKQDLYGDSLQEVVEICTQIFDTFMHTEYGGPGTLMVVPFIDMSDTINERGLPGGPQAARAAVKWAQDHVDKDWNHWTGDE